MNFLYNKNIYISIAIILAGFVLYWLLKKVIEKILKKGSNSKKKRTYIKLINSILKYLFVIVIFVLVLQINGINVTSIVAGVGVVSIIAGLAVQDALKDIIMGFNIIMDNYFSVGDVIKIGEVEGKVTEIGLKATKLKDVNNENIFVISNRSITEALNLSNQLDIDVPISYDESTKVIENIFTKNIIKEILKVENVLNVEYKGIQEFGDSAIYYKIRIQARPEHKPQVKREANRAIKLELDKNNIKIPYMQVDVHSVK